MRLQLTTPALHFAAVTAAFVVLVSAAAAATGPETATQATPESKFDILEFRVLGSHLLPPRDVERAVYAHLGPARGIDDVKKAAASLEKAYKDAGYGTVFVDIPEQTVDDGIVRLKVTEGSVERVRVRGERYFSGRQIRSALAALVPGQTPHLPTLQQELTDLNARSADRAITPVLKAGQEPGTVDIDLAVKDTLPLHGFVQGDNRHTADTTPNRATVSLSYDNLWQRQDSVALLYQTAPARTRNASVEAANYYAHTGSSGGVANLSYTHTSSNVAALGTLGVLGKGTIYGAHWLQPLVSTPQSSQSLTLGIDYKDVLTDVFPDVTPSSPAGSSVAAPVRYLNWSAAYSHLWRASAHTLALNAGLGFGVRDLINRPAEFENARAGGQPGYFYLRLSGEATQALPAGFALLGRLTSQWSADPLVNNEQFALGGLDTVRGYLEAETLGDTGVAGTLELHTPALGRLGATLRPLYGLVFVDAGVTTLLQPLSSQDYNFHLWSAGVGLRLENASGLSGTVDVAIPESTGIRTRKHAGRVDFSVRYGL
jgi:hemolysin activation/secretion protein